MHYLIQGCLWMAVNLSGFNNKILLKNLQLINNYDYCTLLYKVTTLFFM